MKERRRKRRNKLDREAVIEDMRRLMDCGDVAKLHHTSPQAIGAIIARHAPELREVKRPEMSAIKINTHQYESAKSVYKKRYGQEHEGFIRAPTLAQLMGGNARVSQPREVHGDGKGRDQR